MKFTNELKLPHGFVKACEVEHHSTPNSISVTTLLNGIKSKLLKDRHNDEIVVDVSDYVWATFGTAVHKLLEAEGKYDFSEVPIDFTVDDIKIRGRIDNYNMGSEVVADYKTATVWKIKNKDFEDWKKQGLMYAWLLRKNGFECKQCQFIAFLKDFSKAKSKRELNYPESVVYLYQFDVLDKDVAEIEKMVSEKVKQYKEYRELKDDDVPVCSELERWHKEDKYAVYTKAKTGKNKGDWKQKADTVENSNDEAVAWAGEKGLKDDEYEIRKRAGEDTKCLEYCDCKEFCNHYKSLIASQEDTQEEANNG